jgi:hypothetical protein
MMNFGGRTMLSGGPSGDLMRRKSRRAASSPRTRAPIATVVSVGRCIAPFGNVVEADDCDVAPRIEPSIGETEHHPKRAEIVVAKHRGRRLRFGPEQVADRAREAFAPACI